MADAYCSTDLARSTPSAAATTCSSTPDSTCSPPPSSASTPCRPSNSTWPTPTAPPIWPDRRPAPPRPHAAALRTARALRRLPPPLQHADRLIPHGRRLLLHRSGQIDAQRRRDHMQQHSGQHVLSAAFLRLYNMPTVSFHMADDYCSIDLA